MQIDSTGLSHPKYRPDIDGLRALAVLSVVGFHAFPGWVSGGFIGVDIFFVISGYLISTIIFENLEKDTFSFAGFYARRIRRIFPALLVVLAASFVFGWFALFADEYRQLGKHIAGGAGFVSNLVLWGENGYFDNAAGTKPLLHLWSLGIEEQYYIAWPLLVWLAWKRKVGLLATTLVVLAVSFFYNVQGVRYDAVATFYSPLTRFWELLCGSLLAWWVLHRKTSVENLTPAQCNWLSIAGAALLGLALLSLNKEDLFPGWWGVLPVLGTVLVILAGTQARINRAILANRVAVWFGLISFPLYLWHWPLLSFSRIVENHTPGANIKIAAVVISVVLAWLTYRLVEKPVRFGNSGAGRTIGLVVPMIALGCAGFAVYRVDGLAQTHLSGKLDPELLKAVGDRDYPSGLFKRHAGNVGFYANTMDEPRILFIGDSHVEQFAPRIVHLTKQGKFSAAAVLTGGGCPPIPNVFEDAHKNCRGFLEAVGTLLHASRKIRTVVIGGCWNCYFIEQTAMLGVEGSADSYYYRDAFLTAGFRGGEGRKHALIALAKYLESLSQDYEVYLLLDNPGGQAYSPKSISGGADTTRRTIIFGDAKNMNRSQIAATVDLTSSQIELNDELSAIAGRSGAKVIDQLPSLCPKNKCVRFEKDGRPAYSDANHLRPHFVVNSGFYIDRVSSNQARFE